MSREQAIADVVRHRTRVHKLVALARDRSTTDGERIAAALAAIEHLEKAYEIVVSFANEDE